MEDLTGKQFGPYQIVAPLGEGGMASVYKAYQPAMERYVALKILPRHFAEDPQFTARFQREARVLAQLQHPYILPVFDSGQAEGYSYIVMPLCTKRHVDGLTKGQSLAAPTRTQDHHPAWRGIELCPCPRTDPSGCKTQQCVDG